MTQEKSTASHSRIRIFILALATVLIAAGSFFAAKHKNLHTEKGAAISLIPRHGHAERNPDAPQVSKWFSYSMEPEEIYQKFLSRMQDPADLSKIYRSNQDGFIEDNLLNPDETRDACEMLKNAVPSDRMPDENAAKDWYLVFFANGDTIKYTITGNLLQLKGHDFAMQLS